MLDETEHPTCAHCEVILAELERCKPLVPEPTRWGGTPFWGRGSSVPEHQFDHPALVPGDCVCRCHEPWRMLTGIRVAS